MKFFLLSITYLVGILELILGIFFWVTNSKNEIRKVMALLAFSTGIWVVLSGVTSYVPYSRLGHYEIAIVYIFGALLLTALLHLTLIMPYPFFRFDKLHILLLYFPLTFLSYALLFSRTIVESFTGSPTWAGIIFGGPLFSMYNIYLFFLFVLSTGIIFYRLPKLDGVHKQNMKILVWSVILGGLPGIILLLILPTFLPELDINPLLGVIPSAIWVGGVAYIVTRR